MDIIIEVSGGCVCNVYSNENKLNIKIVDWDNNDAGKISYLSIKDMPEDTRKLLEIIP